MRMMTGEVSFAKNWKVIILFVKIVNTTVYFKNKTANDIKKLKVLLNMSKIYQWILKRMQTFIITMLVARVVSQTEILLLLG